MNFTWADDESLRREVIRCVRVGMPRRKAVDILGRNGFHRMPETGPDGTEPQPLMFRAGGGCCHNRVHFMVFLTVKLGIEQQIVQDVEAVVDLLRLS